VKTGSRAESVSEKGAQVVDGSSIIKVVANKWGAEIATEITLYVYVSRRHSMQERTVATSTSRQTFIMPSNKPPRILLFGAGGVGTVYLWLLSRVGSTTAVCRSNYDVVKKDGFILNSSIFGQDIRFKPDVVRNCEEAASRSTGPYDYIVVCSKAIPGMAKLIEPAVTPDHTAIVLVQNGVGIEDEYAQAYSKNPIISAVVYLPATQRPTGVINHGEVEKLQIGAHPSSASSAHAKAFTNLITAAGGTAEWYEDIQLKRWSKLLVNASWNPICALALSKDTGVLTASDEAAGVVLAVMLEVRDIAAAYGHDITREEVETQLGRAHARIPKETGIEPSMMQDVQAGRRIEVDAIVGNPVRMAKEKGVACVRLEMLYVLAKALNAQIGKK
jgi:2-dehydropantoate 2-reductase